MTSEKRAYRAETECLQYASQASTRENSQLAEPESEDNDQKSDLSVPMTVNSIENEQSSSISSSVPGTLFDAIPPLQDQRATVASLWSRFSNAKQEGDTVYIIPERWLMLFQDFNVVDSRSIPPLDVASIVLDYDQFILQEYSKEPYTAIPADIFKLLEQWYGLTPNSKPVTTCIVRDSDNQLIIEYDKPRFRIHHLTTNGGTSNQQVGYRRHGTDLNSSIMFAMSRLSTMEDVVKRCLELFFQKENKLNRASLEYRIWYINDTNENSTLSHTLQTTFMISPSVFLDLPTKHKITRKLFPRQIKDYDSRVINLAVEVKIQGNDEHWPSNYFYYNEKQPSLGITGLTNLGNTCYMNSALQCLLHLPELNKYFLYGGYEKELNPNNPLGHKGNVAHAFGQLVQTLFGSSYSHNSSFAPRSFKSTIGHYNSLFAGFGQQDSQEFLAFLLDGLHEDLNRVLEKPYVEKPELPKDNTTDPAIEIKKLATETWEYVKKRNDSVITDLFVGMYKSTLVCPNCGHVSITFDPYNDLTLPLPIENSWSGKVLIFPQSSPPCSLEIELPKTSTYRELKDYISRETHLNVDALIGFEIFNHQFYTNYESSNEADYLPISELISENDTMVFYEVLMKEGDLVVPVFNTRLEEGYKNPRLFGYPFFIVLSKDEQHCYGAIQKKLEKSYQNMSGGFSEFPIMNRECDSVSLEVMSLLKEKYDERDLASVENELEYINLKESPDTFFQVRVMKEDTVHVARRTTRFGVAFGPGVDTSKSKVWTPTSVSFVNFNNSKKIRDLLPPVTHDAYYYSDLRPSSELNTRFEGDTDKNHNNESELEPDLGIPNKSDNCAIDSKEGQNISGENQIVPLVDTHNALVCQWNNERVSEVFDNEFEVNWDNPGVVENSSLNNLREQRAKKAKSQITLDSCLKLFSQPEVLSTADSWYCPNCKQHTQASKQIELWNTPDILLIHLKRFENQRSFSDKIDATVQFPIEGLDMSPYVTNIENGEGNIYDLVAVDNHYGGLGGGHYTAYCKNFLDSKWYYFDDSRVTETSPENSVAGSAYLLFYRRRVPAGQEFNGTGILQEIISSSRDELERQNQSFRNRVSKEYEASKTDSDDTEFSSSDLEIDGVENGGCILQPSFAEDVVGAKPSSQPGYDSIGHVNDPEDEGNFITSFNSAETKGNGNYNMSSLEVGKDTSFDDHSSSRRKLRLLDRVYLPECSSTTSSVESLSPCISPTAYCSNAPNSEQN